MRSQIHNEELKRIENQLRYFANSTPENDFTEDERFNLLDTAKTISEIRLPIQVIEHK